MTLAAGVPVEAQRGRVVLEVVVVRVEEGVHDRLAAMIVATSRFAALRSSMPIASPLPGSARLVVRA